jgi:type IV pilus assembly protein PilN
MIKINLLPKDVRKRVGIAEQILIIVMGLVITCVAIGLVWNYLNGVIEQKNQQIDQTQARLDELQKVIAEIEEFERQRAALEQKLAIIARLEKEQQLPVHLLDEVYLTMDDDLWLNSFSWAGESINVAGTALSNPVVADYVRNLDKSQFFNNVELGSSTRGTVGAQEIRSFSITANLSVPEELLQSHFIK